MWVLTPFGFFSVVSKDTDPSFVCVRARARDDLVALLDRFPGFDRDLEQTIRRTPTNDYPYRVFISRKRLAAVVEAFIVDELNYGNFKSEVARIAGHRRAAPLHDVWEAMRAVEDADARAPVVPSRHEGSAPARDRKSTRRARS